MRSDFTSARRWTILIALSVLLASAAPSAGSASVRSPRQDLLVAQREIRAVLAPASTSPGRRAEARALKRLARATAGMLWINPRAIVAPSYGASVFADTAAALADLAHIQSLTGASKLILAADRAVASNTIREARGGEGDLLSVARRELAAGDREAATGHRPGSARAYATAWEDAFRAVTGLVVSQATTVPEVDLSAAAENALGSKRIALAGPMIEQGQPPLTADGKPEVFFAGSEACPFCGVQRWGIVVALAQFGTFSNLHLLQSTLAEPPPVQGFTFFGSSYQSSYVAFVPVEVLSNVAAGTGFRHLQHPTPAENALIQRYDPPSQVPFIDVGNRFVTVQSTVQPQLVAGLSWTRVGALLRAPASVPAQAIAGEAEVLTAEICEATNGNPTAVCSQQVVRDYENALPRLNGKGGGCSGAALDRARSRGRGPGAATAPSHR